MTGPGPQPHGQGSWADTLTSVCLASLTGGAPGGTCQMYKERTIYREPFSKRPSYYPWGEGKGEKRGVWGSHGLACLLLSTAEALPPAGGTSRRSPCRCWRAEAGHVWELGGQSHLQPRVRGLASGPQTNRRRLSPEKPAHADCTHGGSVPSPHPQASPSHPPVLNRKRDRPALGGWLENTHSPFGA